MKLARYTPKTPEEAIAFDELLLIKAESGQIGETIWFWDPPSFFVVLGRAREVGADCHLERCRQDGLKIIRRISGGGTVLQGPGCFNYTLVLSYDRSERYRNIRDSYRDILGKISDGLGKKSFDVRFYPLSDLALDGKKISGNAQARKRRFFLHHGTFLCGLDIGKVSGYLSHPDTEPEYRSGRSHENFMVNIPITPTEVRNVIKGAFLPQDISGWRPDKNFLDQLDGLVASKYSKDEWNFAF